jgi:hypothetical protein
MNNIFRMASRFFVAMLIIMLPVHSHAAVKMIAETGQPAPDFPEGFIYWDVDTPAIGASGHVVFSGVADISLGSTENNTNAVWAGMPGELRAIVRENEAVSGFPSNVLFDSAGIGTADGFVVTPSGAVGFSARMKGAGQSTQRALLAHVDGTTYGILREGDPAPGFPAGVFISNTGVGISGFAMSDAGMVITGMTTSNEAGVWLHDFNTINRLPSPVADCSFSSLPAVSINQAGSIALYVSFIGNDNNPCTPSTGLFKWQNGQWQAVMVQDFLPGGGEAVPGMAQAEFNFQTPTFLRKPMIDDQDNLAFPASLRNPSSITQNKGSLWYKADGIEPRLIAQAEETLPGDSNAVIADFSLPFFSSSVSNNGASVVPVTLTTGETAILSGLPRTSQPYSSLQDTGEIQLSVTARQNHRPPGFDETWFYSEFLGQALNRNGDLIFNARSRDAISPNTSIVDAIWRGQIDGEPRLKAMTGMKIRVNGEERILRHIFTIDRDSRSGNVGETQINTNGTPSQFSDTGDFVFAGEVDGSFRSILLIPNDQREQRIFTLAEQLFPQFFAPANAEDRLLEGFEYRFYSGTNAYIGIKDEEVFVLGVSFGAGITRIGTVDETLALLESMVR